VAGSPRITSRDPAPAVRARARGRRRRPRSSRSSWARLAVTAATKALVVVEDLQLLVELRLVVHPEAVRDRAGDEGPVAEQIQRGCSPPRAPNRRSRAPPARRASISSNADALRACARASICSAG
jgi:hypothetical protein